MGKTPSKVLFPYQVKFCRNSLVDGRIIQNNRVMSVFLPDLETAINQAIEIGVKLHTIVWKLKVISRLNRSEIKFYKRDFDAVLGRRRMNDSVITPVISMDNDEKRAAISSYVLG